MTTHPMHALESQVTSTQKWLIFIAMSLGIFMLAFSTTAITNAMVVLRHQMNLDNAQLQWTSSAYMLAAASFVILSGVLGDRFGRRNMYVVGAFIYIGGSLICALSTSAYPFIAGRFVQGLGGALVMPTTLAMMKVVFQSHEQSIVTTGWACGIGLGFGLGPFVSGFMVTTLGWPYLFWFSISIAFVTLVLLLLANHRRIPFNGSVTIDYSGIVVFLLGFPPLIFFLVEGEKLGWHNPLVIGSLLMGLFFMMLFPWLEARIKRTPLVDFHCFRFPHFLMGCIGMLATGYTLIALFFFGNLFFQSPLVKDDNALSAGLAMLPLGGALFVSVLFVEKFIQLIGLRRSVFLTFVLMLGGCLWFACLSDRTPYGLIWPMLALIGFGCGMGFKVFPELALNVLPTEQSARASSLLNVHIYLGAILSMAVGTIVSVFVGKWQFFQLSHTLALPGFARRSLARILMGHEQLLHRYLVRFNITGTLRDQTYQVAKVATLHGFQYAMMSAGVVLIFALAASVWLVDRR